MLLGLHSLASLRREIHDRGHAVTIVTPGTLLAMMIDAGTPTDGFLPENWLAENRAAIEEEIVSSVAGIPRAVMAGDYLGIAIFVNYDSASKQVARGHRDERGSNIRDQALRRTLARRARIDV